MNTEFDRGIAVSAHAGDPTTYDTELSAGWQIGAGINGGLLLASLGNALRATLSASGGHLDPVAISGYYLSAAGLTTARRLAIPGRRTHGGAAVRPLPLNGIRVPRAGRRLR